MIQQRSSIGSSGGMRDDSAEILISSYLQEALVSTSGMVRDVHSLKLFIQHFLCRPRRRPLSKAHLVGVVCLFQLKPMIMPKMLTNTATEAMSTVVISLWQKASQNEKEKCSNHVSGSNTIIMNKKVRKDFKRNVTVFLFLKEKSFFFF